MDRRAFLVALGGVLSGCAAGSDAATTSTTRTTTATDTATDSPTATATTTTTDTDTPTDTPTDTAEPTPTGEELAAEHLTAAQDYIQQAADAYAAAGDGPTLRSVNATTGIRYADVANQVSNAREELTEAEKTATDEQQTTIAALRGTCHFLVHSARCQNHINAGYDSLLFLVDQLGQLGDFKEGEKIELEELAEESDAAANQYSKLTNKSDRDDMTPADALSVGAYDTVTAQLEAESTTLQTGYDVIQLLRDAVTQYEYAEDGGYNNATKAHELCQSALEKLEDLSPAETMTNEVETLRTTAEEWEEKTLRRARQLADETAES